MASDICIRPLEQSDKDDWRRLWTAYLEFYETTVSEDVYRTSFARLMSDEDNEYKCLIAEVGGKPVGLAHFLYHRSMWTVENTCYLMDLFTDPGVRGRGVGRALIEAVRQTARRDGVPGIYWQTQEFNYKGRMLYDQVATRTPFIIYEMANEGFETDFCVRPCLRHAGGSRIQARPCGRTRKRRNAARALSGEISRPLNARPQTPLELLPPLL